VSHNDLWRARRDPMPDARAVLSRALLVARRRRRYRVGLAVVLVLTVVAVLTLVH
jgi:hypothetical protein